MNRLKIQLLCLTALVSATHLFGGGTTTNIVPRSQSFNAARQMVGWNNPEWGINRYPQDDYYASLNLTFAYTRTFKADKLAQCLFGSDLTCNNRLCTGCNTCEEGPGINITGSAVADRGATDWLADYFGLPRDFESTIYFKPTISNFILDFSFYAGLDAWVEGMYLRVHTPFVHTKWNLNAEESIARNGSIGYFQGYFSALEIPAEDVAGSNTVSGVVSLSSSSSINHSFLAYADGCTPTINTLIPSLPNLTSGTITPITWDSLCCSRINCEGKSRNGFAEVRMVLGYNFLNDADEQYHAGLGVYIAAPTGTRVGDQDCDGKGRYLFEPIVGNGKHWELGAQVTAHHIFWNNRDNSKSLGLYVEANATHLFAARQTRCFDLISAGSSSRYMLAEKFGPIRNSPEWQNGATSIAPALDPLGVIFDDQYSPVANLTSRTIKSSIAVQGDIAVSIAFQSDNFQWDLGYNFWGRTCENLCIDECCPIDLSNWALKGDQRVVGFRAGAGPSFIPMRIYPTDSHATIHAGSNLNNGVDYTGVNPTAPVNFYADNSVALSTTATPPNTVNIRILPNGGAPIIYASQNPIFIKESDFDLTGTRGTSNKIFTNFNWKFDARENCSWTPYAGIGAEVEFGTTEGNCCNNQCSQECAPACGKEGTTDCNTPAQQCSSFERRASAPGNCVDCALTQWGVWLKIGASYN